VYTTATTQALSTLTHRYSGMNKKLKLRALREHSLRALVKQSTLLHEEMMDASHAPLIEALQTRYVLCTTASSYSLLYYYDSALLRWYSQPH
jgi:hypothetical protein